MAVETSTQRVSSSEQANEGGATSNAGLLPGERVISHLDSSGDGSFRLTHARVILSGGSDSDAVYASAQLRDITSIKISRRPRARRSAAWGTIGLFAAIGVWQVTPNSNVGVIAAIAVALISLVLMGDYWIRPAGVHMEFHTAGGNKIGGEIGSKTARALQFIHDVEDAKRRLVPGGGGSSFRSYSSG